METLLAPLLALLAVTAALIPVLILPMLRRPVGPQASGRAAAAHDAPEPIWRAWVDSRGSATPSPGTCRSDVVSR